MKPQEHMDYNVVYNVRGDRVEGYHHGYHGANNKKKQGTMVIFETSCVLIRDGWVEMTLMLLDYLLVI